MVMWTVARVVIFSASLLCGVLISNYNRSSDPARALSETPRLSEAPGASLLVACEAGRVIVTPSTKPTAVGLKCVSGKMFVVKDHVAQDGPSLVRPVTYLN